MSLSTLMYNNYLTAIFSLLIAIISAAKMKLTLDVVTKQQDLWKKMWSLQSSKCSKLPSNADQIILGRCSSYSKTKYEISSKYSACRNWKLIFCSQVALLWFLLLRFWVLQLALFVAYQGNIGICLKEANLLFLLSFSDFWRFWWKRLCFVPLLLRGNLMQK